MQLQGMAQKGMTGHGDPPSRTIIHPALEKQGGYSSFGAWHRSLLILGFPGGTSGKEPACQCWRHKRCRFHPWIRKIPLEEEMATHSNILAWRIPGTEEPGGLQFMGLQRVEYDWSDSMPSLLFVARTWIFLFALASPSYWQHQVPYLPHQGSGMYPSGVPESKQCIPGHILGWDEAARPPGSHLSFSTTQGLTLILWGWHPGKRHLWDFWGTTFNFRCYLHTRAWTNWDIFPGGQPGGLKESSPRCTKRRTGM